MCPVKKRAEQREETRERIVDAAVSCFAEFGFRGASTREIARRAGANQGLITYHFRSKDELWRAAADRIFGLLKERLARRMGSLETSDPQERAREGIREYVRFAADHPELFHFMVEQGKSDDERMAWLVDRHIDRFYQTMPAGDLSRDPALRPHLFYLLAGAGSVIFAVAPECRRVTGLDPTTEPAVETHADLVARLVVP